MVTCIVCLERVESIRSKLVQIVRFGLPNISTNMCLCSFKYLALNVMALYRIKAIYHMSCLRIHNYNIMATLLSDTAGMTPVYGSKCSRLKLQMVVTMTRCSDHLLWYVCPIRRGYHKYMTNDRVSYLGNFYRMILGSFEYI